MDSEMWDRVNQLRGWLDDNAGELTERERKMMRVLKIGEEFGEVSEALHGALAANPRKGRSHTWEDVSKELVDVAVTTLVALATIDPDGAKTLDARLQHLVDRVLPPSEESAA
ncbi:MazG-like family protein [Streptomyces atroolivaceus]|uniref:MazG-like family protein n=1 Tax=Streptomyces atroolivaceus TaxID=66869 RepID=UPI00364DA609